MIKAEHKFQGKGASEGRGVSVGGDPCRWACPWVEIRVDALAFVMMHRVCVGVTSRGSLWHRTYTSASRASGGRLGTVFREPDIGGRERGDA